MIAPRDTIAEPVTATDDHLRLEFVFDRLRRLKEEWVDTTRNWYTKRAPWHRRAFRVSGTLVILFSVSIPFLVDRDDWRWSGAAVSFLSLAIAALTGLMSFFQWQSSWHKHIRSQLRLEHLTAMWELEMTEAQQERDPTKAKEMAVKATRKLLSMTGALTVEEAQEFFEGLKAPGGRAS
jgi:hypothetical protein